jgi:lysophospholipase L1-like esterase
LKSANLIFRSSEESFMSLLAKLALSPLLVTQAVLTRARMPTLPEADGPRQGVVGAQHTGQAMRLLVVGDSSAAGVGVASQQQALVGHLTVALAGKLGRPVSWQLVAQSGLSTAECLALLEQTPVQVADVAVVALGVNDVVTQVPSYRAVGHREALANHLRNRFGVAHVVFMPLPPVHEFPGLPQPLRWIAGADARRHDAAMAAWAAGRADVSHVEIDLALNTEVMAGDGFHPGETVYRICGVALAEHIADRVFHVAP